jgi:hypothetical protein
LASIKSAPKMASGSELDGHAQKQGVSRFASDKIGSATIRSVYPKIRWSKCVRDGRIRLRTISQIQSDKMAFGQSDKMLFPYFRRRFKRFWK